MDFSSIPESVHPKIFDAQPYQVGRLLITETARVQGDVQLDSYKQGGIEWYDISMRVVRGAFVVGLHLVDHIAMIERS